MMIFACLSCRTHLFSGEPTLSAILNHAHYGHGIGEGRGSSGGHYVSWVNTVDYVLEEGRGWGSPCEDPTASEDPEQ